MKTFFLCIICLSIGASGIVASMRLKKREKTLFELSRLLKYIARNVKDSRRELGDIFLSFDSPYLDKIGFSQNLGSEGFNSAVKKLDIPQNCKESLSSFSSSLGKTFADDQISGCLECAAALDLIISDMKKNYPEKRRLYIGLSLLLASALFIICI